MKAKSLALVIRNRGMFHSRHDLFYKNRSEAITLVST